MRSIRISTALLMILALSAIAGGEKEHEGKAHDDHSDATNTPSIAVTQWTGHMELFMEYPVLVVNEPGRFIIHLTILDGFQPVREGSATLAFGSPHGKTYKIESTQILREGIFAPSVELPDAGSYEFVLSYVGPDVSDVFHIDDFIVYSSADDILTNVDEDPAGEISFLKEQQWKIPFATAEVEVREVKRAIWAIAEVLPSPKAYTEIIAPVDGIVQISTDDNMALPGSAVRRGEVLATITPPVKGDGWVASRLAFEQAKRDYERAQRLKDLEAISQRELELTRNEFQTRKARFESIADGGNVDALTLKAPISGKIIEWMVRPGQLVRSGDKLMAVVDPSVVWLKVSVYENDFRIMGRPVGALINADDGGGGWLLQDDDMRVLTTGGALDAATRTIPVLLEVANESGRLTINELTPIELFTSEGDSGIVVPRTAVYDDDGIDMVFVQTGGESFEKRLVVLGPYYSEWVSILEGIRLGERIVSQGGYHVKLASTSAEIGHGHAH